MPTNDLPTANLLTGPALVTRLLELYSGINERVMCLEDLMGEGTIFLTDEMESLHELILDVSGATARRKHYQQKLVDLGAPCATWNCLQSPSNSLFDFIMEATLTVEEVVRWLAMYVNDAIDFKEINPEVVAKRDAICKSLADAYYHKLTMDCDY